MHYEFIHATQDSLIRVPLAVDDSAIHCSANRIPAFGSVNALKKTKSIGNSASKGSKFITTPLPQMADDLPVDAKPGCGQSQPSSNRYSVSSSKPSARSPQHVVSEASHCQMLRAHSSYPTPVLGDPQELESALTLTGKDLEGSGLIIGNSLPQMDVEILTENSQQSVRTPPLDPKSMRSLFSRGTNKIESTNKQSQTDPSNKHHTEDNLKIDTIVDIDSVLARIPCLTQYMEDKQRDHNGSSRSPIKLKSQRSSFGGQKI